MHRKIAARIVLVLLLCNLGFIWGNSWMRKDSSHALSSSVLEYLPAFLENLFPNPEQLEHLIRKLAHFSEFACLGALGCGELLLLRKKSLHWLGHLVCGGFFVAAIDETIQIFSHRGSQLQDVWLDFSGFIVGTLLLLAAVAIRRAWVNRHTR